MKSIRARLGVLAPLLALAWLTGLSACGGGDDHTTELKNETAPYLVPLARAAVQVSAGWAHTCAVLADGSAACWGGNQFGQLGNGGQALVGCADGFAVCSNGPVAVSGATTWARVAGGFLFTCGTDAASAAHCWGAGRRGQLGDGTQTTSNVPTNVSGGLVFSALAAATGGDLACGLSAGALYCWGSGYHGQPGNGSVSQLASVPYRVSPTQQFTALAVGEVHACALDGSGAAFCWGANHAGQVGDGTLVDRTLPAAALGGRSYTQIVAGLGHTCALDAGGVATCWGASGRIGRASASVADQATPGAVAGAQRFVQIAAGGWHTCGIDNAGQTWCWGDNSRAQFGDGTLASSQLPVRIAGLPEYTEITAGGCHTCGATAAGAVWCWGADTYGQSRLLL
jgi:alpha-tubulin suppressor-like RCC1 family protein